MIAWQERPRGTWSWSKLSSEPDRWWAQTEYRKIKNGVEVWRSPHINGYSKRPPISKEWVND